MRPDRQQMAERAQAAAVLLGVLGLFLAAPGVALSVVRLLSQPAIDALYFFPQYVFPFGDTYPVLAVPSPTNAPVGHWASVLVWGTVTLGFGWIGRRWPLRWRVPVAFGAILLTTGLIHLSLPLLHLRFYLDGPH